jgi:hypothetical protein
MTMKMAIKIAIDIIIATAMPAGVIPPPEDLEGFGVSCALRGLVGTGVAEVEVVEVIEGVEEDVVEEVVDSVEVDSTLDVVDVMVVSSSSSSLSFGSLGVGVCLGLGSDSVEVGSGLKTLETKLSKGSSSCRSSSGTARTPPCRSTKQNKVMKQHFIAAERLGKHGLSETAYLHYLLLLTEGPSRRRGQSASI